MFGTSHTEMPFEGRWAGGPPRRGRFLGHGFGGRRGRHGHGMDDDDPMMRAGRMLAHGDLRLIALALIAQQPRHGYEIIKLIEEKTFDWYSPSPGIVYPTLTFLEEAAYVTAQADGSKKLYTITDDGRGYLAINRDLADAGLERLDALGERAQRWRRRSAQAEDDRHAPAVPPLVKAALGNLRDAAAKRLDGDADAEAAVVEILARAATELRRS